MTPAHPPTRRGFTLVEILIVVVILGVLAAIVIPQFASAAEDSRKTTFVTSLRQFTSAAMLYQQDHDVWLEDSSTGTMPTGFADYIENGKWEQVTTIGGRWDVEYQDAGGVTSALGVVFDGSGTTRDDAYMTTIDAILDDGDLSTGSFRKIAGNRYYTILEE